MSVRLRRAITIAVGLSVATFAGGFFVTQHALRMSGVRINLVTMDYEVEPERLAPSQIDQFDLSPGLNSVPLQLAIQQNRRLQAHVNTRNLAYLGATPASKSSLESLEPFVQ
ncbi:MAG: hypothetical protein ACTS2F_10190 [Thainema sp.]